MVHLSVAQLVPALDGGGVDNSQLIYYFAKEWAAIQPRLANMEAAHRELVLDQLELAISIEEDENAGAGGFYTSEERSAAAAASATARQTYPDAPGGKGDPIIEEDEE